VAGVRRLFDPINVTLILGIMGSPTLLIVFFLGLQRALEKGKRLEAREAAVRAS